MSPDEINAAPGGPFYRCRRCRTATGLSWHRGTSCPVCSNPECIAFCDREWNEAYAEAQRAMEEDPYA